MWLFRKKEKEQNNKELQAILACLQKQEEVEIRLSIRSAVMYEALSGKKFSAALSEQSDLIILMYCAFVCSTGIEISMDAFASMLENEKFSKKIGRDLKRLEKFTMQFRNENSSANNEQSGKTEQDKTDFSITEMVDKLIFYYWVDAKYVMENMQLWELNHFMKGAEDQYKEKMEEQRLWTFLQVAPQIDLKKCKGPEQFFPFPWSKEENKQRKQKELAAEAGRAKATIGMKLNLNPKKEENG